MGMTRKDAIEILEEVKTIDDSMFAYSQTYNDALNMAIEALKVQEPRVMTLEEIQHTDAVWLETHGWPDGDVSETVLRHRSDFEDYVTEFTTNDDCDITCDNSKIGIKWRCWTSEPSEELRKKAKWNDEV